MSTDVTAEVCRLRDSGVSFGKIAKQFGISKTRAFELARGQAQNKKEVNAKAERSSLKTPNVPAATLGSIPNEVLNVRNSILSSEELLVAATGPMPANAVPNSVPARLERSEQNVRDDVDQAEHAAADTVPEASVPASVPNVPALIKVKEFTGDELVNKTFDCLPFTGKFEALIGRPSRIFSAVIWGLPKGGKSNLSVRFADYLQEYFGRTLYVASEEGESLTLQEKFRDIGGSKMTIVELRDKDKIRQYVLASDFEFVFIDSINNAGIDADFLEGLKSENPAKSFISICQATKSGNFKGDQAITHNCDFIIKVVAGVASQSGRFGPGAEMAIFDEPLYEKNPAQRVGANSSKVTSEVKQEPAVKLEHECKFVSTHPIAPVASLLPGLLKALEHHALNRAAQAEANNNEAEQDRAADKGLHQDENSYITHPRDNPFVADLDDVEPEAELQQVTAPKYSLQVELAMLRLNDSYPLQKYKPALGNASSTPSPSRTPAKARSQQGKTANKKRSKRSSAQELPWWELIVDGAKIAAGVYIGATALEEVIQLLEGGSTSTMR